MHHSGPTFCYPNPTQQPGNFLKATDAEGVWEFNMVERDIVYEVIPHYQRRRLHAKLAQVRAWGPQTSIYWPSQRPAPRRAGRPGAGPARGPRAQPLRPLERGSARQSFKIVSESPTAGARRVTGVY